MKEDSSRKRGVTNSWSSQRCVDPSAQLLIPVLQPFVDFCSLFMAEKRPKDTLCGPVWVMGGREGEGKELQLHAVSSSSKKFLS